MKTMLSFVCLLSSLTLSQNTDTLWQKAFWDSLYSKRGVTDKATIGEHWDRTSVEWHYTFIETCLIQHLSAGREDIFTVLDLGSGAGHWVQFYDGLGYQVIGNDISQTVIDTLHARYPYIKMYRNSATEFLDLFYKANLHYEIINAIGILHHITDKNEWAMTLKLCQFILPKEGLLFISSQFISKEEVTYFKGAKTTYKVYRPLQDYLYYLPQMELIAYYKSEEPKGIRNHDDLIVLRKK
jgi:2-polyprenyl-3-methyl-5-hydroxy-6-metoxy-1,4-benzoquinol methylase